MLTRRSFGQLLGVMSGEAALAQMSYVGPAPSGGVMINANENPLGPCAEALEAMAAVLPRGGRYLFGESLKLSRMLAAQEGVRPEYVQAFAGSSDPLHRVVLAFTSKERGFVVADPGYEAGVRAAEFTGAPVHKVALTTRYAHDVKAMLAASPNGGVYYVCTPNNPTGTLTPREDIEFLVKNKPAGSVVLIDEAYMHFAGSSPCTDMVAADKDVIVLRTFSKIYGMAGLRAGAAFGRPDLLEKIAPYGTGFLPTTAMVGAAASLGAKSLVATRRKILEDTRGDVFEWMEKKKFGFVPSVSNKFMAETGRPAGEVIRAMAEKKVFIGRPWPAWPTHVRVTVGTPDEMAKFKTAYESVMG